MSTPKCPINQTQDVTTKYWVYWVVVTAQKVENSGASGDNEVLDRIPSDTSLCSTNQSDCLSLLFPRSSNENWLVGEGGW
jgi:hypothetical protein